MQSETPQFISSRFGRMFLITHTPSGSPPDTWVIALNSGLQNRTGSRRLYLQLARRLADDGFGVIRVDLPGVGDSEGPPPGTHFDCHSVEDVRTIKNYVQEKYNPRHTVLLGLCAGARVAIKAANEISDIDAVVAMSTPIYTASPGSTRSPAEPKHRLSKSVAKQNLARMKSRFSKRKLFRWSFWRKSLRFEKLYAELSTLILSGWFLIRRNQSQNNANVFVETLRSYVKSGRQVLFVYGDRDQPGFGEFLEMNGSLDCDSVVVVPGGSHTFSTRSSHCQVIDETTSWLKQCFPEA